MQQTMFLQVYENLWENGAVPDALMITWEHFCQSEEGGIIGHKTWGEDKGCIFLVKKSQFFLKSHMVVTCPRDVPGATCSCTMFFQNIPGI